MNTIINKQCDEIVLNVTLDFNKICRSCLQQNDVLLSLNDQSAETDEFLSLSDMLKVFKNLLINENDGLPDKVCQQCALVINSAYLFYIKFQQSIFALNQLIENDAKSIELSINGNNDLLSSIKEDNLSSIIITNSNTSVLCQQDNSRTSPSVSLDNLIVGSSNTPLNDNNTAFFVNNYNTIKSPILISNRDNKRKHPVKILPKLFDCNKTEKSIISKNNHINPSEDKQSKKCLQCEKTFDNETLLKIHECFINFSYQCDMCNVKHKTQLDLDKHKNIEHIVNKRKYNCNLCTKQFSSIRGRSMHLFQHKKNYGEFTCKLCFIKFNQRLRYIFHKKMHEANVCYYCDHGFLTKDSMLFHIENTHLLRRKFPCIFCRKEFSTKRIMLRHVKLAHNINKIYFCGICNNSKIGYIALNYLQKHLDKHLMNENINDIIIDDNYDNDIFVSNDKCLESIEHNNIDEGLQISLFNENLTNNDNDFLDINTNNYKLSIESFDNFVNDNTSDDFNVPFIDEDNYELNVNTVDNVEILTDILNINEKPDELFNNFLMEPKDSVIKTIKTHLVDKSTINENEILINIEIDNKLTNRYKCPKCINYFDKQSDMKIHLAHVHNESVLTCNQCGATFNRTDDIDSHRLEHYKENRKLNSITEAPETIDNQDLVVDKNNTFNYKIIRNGNQINYECCLCDRTFQRKTNLHKHKCEFNNDKKLLIACSFCNKTFTTNHALCMHKKTHLDKSLTCSLCDKMFTTVGGLKYHLKTHTGIKAFVCPICDRKFTANINLTAHIRGVHSEIKPHTCGICERSFATVDRIKKHIKTHSGERNFKCLKCGKSYYQSSHLSQHMRNHTGIKPYKCNLCSAEYFCAASVKKHLHAKHSIAQPTEHDYKVMRIYPTDN